MGQEATDFGLGMATEAAGGIMGLALGAINDNRQYNQQTKLQGLQIRGQKEMADYQYKKQMQMWDETNYNAQMKQLEKAGLNPGLIYGMGGGGGATTAAGTGGAVTGAHAPTGGGEAVAMGQQAMSMALMRAQKENIEADTANKKASTGDLTASAESKGLDNAFKAWMQSTTPEGEDVGSNMQRSTRGQAEVTKVKQTETETQFKLDENERQKLMNNKVMEEIGAKISLMAQQGQTQQAIYQNLLKEGEILKAEIEWNKLDLKKDNLGKFLTNMIKMAFKPK